MSSGAPDLFVVCKSCRAEVSPYITECPYCGNRLRKRAPKLDREGRVTEPTPSRAARRRRRSAAPSLGRLRTGEIPGVRGDARPWLTVAWVVASLVVLVVYRAHPPVLDSFVVFDGGPWWHIATAPFLHVSSGYAFVALSAVALFGWLLERRHGFWAVGLVALAGGAGGMALAQATGATALGANGAALALLAAWAVPDLLRWRRDEEWESDLLGAGVFALVIALLPAVVPEADWVAGFGGGLIGLLLGVALARFRPVT